MVAALEEQCSQEVINHDEAIKLLKEENESLEAERLIFLKMRNFFLWLVGRLCL
jgi:hypothetical protein